MLNLLQHLLENAALSLSLYYKSTPSTSSARDCRDVRSAAIYFPPSLLTLKSGLGERSSTASGPDVGRFENSAGTGHHHHHRQGRRARRLACRKLVADHLRRWKGEPIIATHPACQDQADE